MSGKYDHKLGLAQVNMSVCNPELSDHLALHLEVLLDQDQPKGDMPIKRRLITDSKVEFFRSMIKKED